MDIKFTDAILNHHQFIQKVRKGEFPQKKVGRKCFKICWMTVQLISSGIIQDTVGIVD